MEMLRWTCGCTKLDKIRNEDFWKRMKKISKSDVGEETEMEWACGDNSSYNAAMGMW